MALEIFGCLLVELKNKKLVKTIIISGLSLGVLALLLYIVGFRPLIIENIFDIFSNSIGNRVRLKGMSFGLIIAKEYFPLGCGYNLATVCMQEMGFYYYEITIFDVVKSVYSGLIELFASLGIFSISFFYLVFDLFKKILKRKNIESYLYAIMLISFCIMFALTDLIFDLLFGTILGVILLNIKEQANE